MADIKLTLSTDRLTRAPNIKAEVAWLKEVGKLWYPVGRGRPKKAEAGCWVYFIRAGQVVARARADRFDPPESTGPKTTYTGESAKRTRWEVRISELHVATHPIPHKGFQGFRYVNDAEERAFKRAFERPPTEKPAGTRSVAVTRNREI